MEHLLRDRQRGEGSVQMRSLGLFAFALVFTCSAALVASPDERLQFADGLYARGLYDLALKEYESFLREAPEGHAKADVAHFRLGECFRRAGNASGADKEFRLVFVKFPESEFRFRAGFRRAEIFMEAKQPEEAADLFRAVIDAGPPAEIESASRYYLANALFRTEKRDEAMTVYRDLVGRFSDSEFASYALLKLGELHAESRQGETADAARNRNAEALAFYTRASASPASPRVGAEALFQMAELHFRQGEFDKSARAFRALMTKYPEDRRVVEGRLKAAWSAHNAGMYADSLKYAEAGLEREAGTGVAEWLYLKGNCERQLMKNDAAVGTYTELLNKHSGSRFENAARYELALTLHKMGRFRDALRAMSSVEADSELRKDMYWLRAEAHAALKEHDEAVQYYRLLVRDFPESDVAGDAAYRLAHHLQSKGEYKEASKYYNRVASWFTDTPLAPQALFASGFCLAEAGMHAEAARDWSLLLDKYAGSKFAEEALYQRAMCEVRLDRGDAAAASLRDLLKRFPNTDYAPDVHYWLGMFHWKAEALRDAEESFRRTIAARPRKELERESTFQLAHVLRERKKLDEAAELFQSLLATPLRRRLPGSLLRWLSEYAYDKNRPADADRAAGVLVELMREPAWQQIGFVLSGRALLAQDKKGEAREAYRKALEADVRTTLGPEAALRLGDLALEAREYDEAARRFAAAARWSDDESMPGARAHSYAGLGKAEVARTNLQSAARYFMSVAILYDDPEVVPECLYAAAGAFGKLGREADRRKALTELSERYPDSAHAKKALRESTE